MPVLPKKKPSSNDASDAKDLAMAYAVKSRNKPKKFAKGGRIPDEKKEMPAAQSQDKWTDLPVKAQAQKASPTALTQPKIMGSDAFSVRDRDEVMKDKMPMSSMKPASPKAQPRMDVPMMAEGGAVDMADEEDALMHHSSMVAAIMARRQARMMADGGMVDIEDNAQESPNMFDKSSEAALKENYDDDMSDLEQPEDSNETSPEHDEEDQDDMISTIRKKMGSKRA